MNINDVKLKNNIKSMKDLLKYAKKQFVVYEKIEGIENWENYYFSLDYSADQIKLKDMLEIRFVEELTEATKATDNYKHFLEEIADSLNFFLGAYIMFNFDFNKVLPIEKILNKKDKLKILRKKRLFQETYKVVEAVGYLCNLLKNRPWSQSNYLVDMLNFEKRSIDLYNIYFNYLKKLKISYVDLFEVFLQKYEVNLFRIKTNY